MRVVVVARGLAHPFSLAFLPNGDALVTERGTRLRLVQNATGARAGAAKVDPDPVAGLPADARVPDGGLQEIALHPKFATNGLVYFTYNKAGEVERDEPAAATERHHAGARQLRRQGAHGVEDLFVGDWNTGAVDRASRSDLTGCSTSRPARRSAIRRRTRTPCTARCCACAMTARCPPTIRLSARPDTGPRSSRWAIAISWASRFIRPPARC